LSKEKKKLSRFTVTLIVIFVLVIGLVLGGLVFAQKFFGLDKKTADIWALIKPIEGTPGEIAEEFPDVKRVNVLVLGVEELLTDTIMLASFDMDNKKVDVLSVPRDTYYERTDGYNELAYQKINSQFGTGGPTASAIAVADTLDGTPIHFYAAITDGGIKNVVDALGGVKFDVPMDMQYTDARRGLYIDLQKGEQTLDGDKAIQLLRFRKGYPEGDLGRVKTQQAFVKEVFKQSIGLGFPKVVKVVMRDVDRNIENRLATAIAGKAVGMEKGAFKIRVLPGDTQMIRGGSFFIPDEEKTKELMRKLYERSITDFEEANEKKEEEKKDKKLFGFIPLPSFMK
jgi:LCP family protein required for cell wall assembly